MYEDSLEESSQVLVSRDNFSCDNLSFKVSKFEDQENIKEEKQLENLEEDKKLVHNSKDLEKSLKLEKFIKNDVENSNLNKKVLGDSRGFNSESPPQVLSKFQDFHLSSSFKSQSSSQFQSEFDLICF